MNEKLKRYDGIVWGEDPESIGQRTYVYATDSKDAKRKFVEMYGDDKIYSIWNEEDRRRPR